MKSASLTARIVFLALQSVIVVLCSWYAVFVYYTDVLPNRQVKKAYGRTVCHVLQSRLREKKTFFGLVSLYRADFTISYSALGPVWTSETSGHGLGRGYSTDLQGQRALVAQLPSGSAHACWFNPNLPQKVVLVPVREYFSEFRFFVPFMLAALMICRLTGDLVTGAGDWRSARLVQAKT